MSVCPGQPDFAPDNQILKTGCPYGQPKYFLVKYAHIFDPNAFMEHWLDIIGALGATHMSMIVTFLVCLVCMIKCRVGNDLYFENDFLQEE